MFSAMGSTIFHVLKTNMMAPLSCRFFYPVFLALVVAYVLCISNSALAGDQTEASFNFDTQMISIFEVTQTAPDRSPDNSVDAGQRKVLATILDLFRQHKMMLKNVVYRTDTNTIRITWADEANKYVVKSAYKTDKDPILGNSTYADKRQLTSVKIMFLKPDGSYDYLHLENTGLPDIKRSFVIDGHMPDEKCGFCHILAQNDGSPSGVFFPRYQEGAKAEEIKNMGNIFHLQGFEKVNAARSQSLGLPAMKEDFLYRSVPFGYTTNDVSVPHLIRAVIELPQLIEIMARDNGKSICVTFDAPASVKQPSPNNYVCADNIAETLYVRMTNPLLATNKDSKDYKEPYFKKK